MDTTAYVALSRQMALSRGLDVLANNVANATTAGFKAEQVLYEQVPENVGERVKVAFTQDLATVRDLSGGPLRPTGNRFDVAVDGPGYLVVQTADGPRYTRAGQLRLDDAFRLVNAAGLPVLGEGGAVELPEEAQDVTIGADGTLSTPEAVLGRLRVVSFANEQALTPLGDGLYATDQPPLPATGARVVQGMIEGSNVVPVLELTEMIATLRAFQGAQAMIDTHHELARRAIERMLPTNV